MYDVHLWVQGITHIQIQTSNLIVETSKSTCLESRISDLAYKNGHYSQNLIQIGWNSIQIG